MAAVNHAWSAHDTSPCAAADIMVDDTPEPDAPANVDIIDLSAQLFPEVVQDQQVIP